MKKEIIIAGTIVGLAILVDGHLDRRYEGANVDRCAAAIVELDERVEISTARLACLKNWRIQQ